MTNLPNGVHFDVPREDYDAIDAVNWSRLKMIGKSPAHYRHNLLTPSKDTDARKRGRAVHMAVFEPERYLSATIVWDAGRRHGRKWDAFVEKNEGKDILTAAEARAVQDLANAIRSDATAEKYVSGGRAEVTVLWEESGIRCKGRLDFAANCGALVDIKTTRDASPEGFGREVWRYQYHVQASWYRHGWEKATGTRLPFVFVAVEADPPHVVQVYRVPEPIMDLGTERWTALLEHLAFCRQESRWPGYFDGEGELELPRWATSFPADDDVSDLGLIIGGEAA